MLEHGVNPCCEIELAGSDLCNLREISFLDYFIRQIDDEGLVRYKSSLPTRIKERTHARSRGIHLDGRR